MALPPSLQFPEAGEPNGEEDAAGGGSEGGGGGDGGDGTVVTFLDAERG